MKKVIVRIDGGIMSLVRNDSNIEVELRDYDIEDCTNDELRLAGQTPQLDDDGNRYVLA